MKKLIITALVLMALLMCGCTDKTADTESTPTENTGQDGTDISQEINDSDTRTSMETAKNVTSLNISAEELEALGEELNQMQYEDLEGFSE